MSDAFDRLALDLVCSGKSHNHNFGENAGFQTSLDVGQRRRITSITRAGRYNRHDDNLHTVVVPNMRKVGKNVLQHS